MCVFLCLGYCCNHQCEQWAHECSDDRGVSVEAVFAQFDRDGRGVIDPLEVSVDIPHQKIVIGGAFSVRCVTKSSCFRFFVGSNDDS